MKVIDCFTFFEELDMLEIRMKYLNNVVDRFIIVESNTTFSGKPKPYNLEENWERYKSFHKKMVYIQIEQSTTGLVFDKTLKTYTPTDGAWELEYEQREALSMYNDYIDDHALVMMGDLDEIPSTEAVQHFRDKGLDKPVTFCMNYHTGFLNNQCVKGPDAMWLGTVISPAKYFKEHRPQAIRDTRHTHIGTSSRGFHFSFMGGVKAIQSKIQSFSHTEYDREEVLDPQRILTDIQAGRDVLGRQGVQYKVVPLESFPYDLQRVLREYKHLLLET